MTAKAVYPRGSEWRKWDLHLHSPGTKKNDGYQSAKNVWDEYCEILESSDVEVFGVTDYFSADGYFNTVREFASRYPASRKRFFANLELCTTDVINKQSEEVNVHIIFSEAAVHKAKEFLTHLQMNETDAKGRHFRASELTSQDQYERATTTRDYILRALQDTFGAKAVLPDYVLIVAAVNNDGIRPERGIKRKAVNSDEFDKFSDAFFGNSNNTEYFLNANRLESGDKIDPKPVITGSDAHSFSDLRAWLGNIVPRDGQVFKQCTWIKADPTFEGLKQIKFEPADRVFIGDEPDILSRVRTNPRRYLRELRVTHTKSYGFRFGAWFSDEHIPLNPEMVAVIGNKGSGKSALTDILGLVGNSHNQRYERGGKAEELFSFLNKDKFLKGNCASHFVAEGDWYAGDPDQAQLDGSVDVSLPERLEYLPQKYLEKICANIDDDEFRHKLDQVIFGYVSADDRFGKNSLEELVGYLTAQATEDIAAAAAVLHSFNQQVVEVERKLAPDHKREIENRIKLKLAEIAAHTRPLAQQKPPDADTSATAEIAILENHIRQLSKQIAALEEQKPRIAKEVEDLNQAKHAIERNAAGLRGLEEKYKALFQTAGIDFKDIVRLSVDFASLDAAIQTRRMRVNELVSALQTKDAIDAQRLKPSDAEKQVQASLVCQRADLEAKRKEIIDRLSKPIRDYQNYLRVDQEWQVKHLQLAGEEAKPAVGTLNWLKQEYKRITDEYPEQLRSLRMERGKASRAVFAKKRQLVDFYTAIKQSIDKEIAKYKDELRGYAISIEAGLRLDSTFYEGFWSFIAQNVKGSFYGGEDGKNLLARLVEQVMAWDDENEVFQFLGSMLDHIDRDKRVGLPEEDRSRDLFKQLRDKKDPVEFYDFLFSFPYLKLKYDLKVDQKDLSELSPGERGGLLLVFYLMLDKREIPLVIDQPEDNLDNKSVYEILVTFLKKAKKRRQIIIATHNPNLAVVADSEQIIHVSIDKSGQGTSKNDFSHRSGSIEDPHINGKVVEILEGTMPAFDNRRLKYRRDEASRPP